MSGYRVLRYRWTSGASDSGKTVTVATLDKDTTAYTDTSTSHEVFYEYNVRAYNWGG